MDPSPSRVELAGSGGLMFATIAGCLLVPRLLLPALRPGAFSAGAIPLPPTS